MFYNIIVTLIKLCALIGLNCNKINYKARNGECEICSFGVSSVGKFFLRSTDKSLNTGKSKPILM